MNNATETKIENLTAGSYVHLNIDRKHSENLSGWYQVDGIRRTHEYGNRDNVTYVLRVWVWAADGSRKFDVVRIPAGSTVRTLA